MTDATYLNQTVSPVTSTPTVLTTTTRTTTPTTTSQATSSTMSTPTTTSRSTTTSPGTLKPITCRPNDCCEKRDGCRPKPPGCCVIIMPCRQPCQPFHHVCSSMCTSMYMYAPVNPCGSGGCQRRSYYVGKSCGMSGYCRQTMNDCSGCQMGVFYSSYDGYQRCGGCFY